MTDLTKAEWAEIERQGVLIGNDLISKCISLGTLKTILKKARRTDSQNRLLWSLYADILRLGGESLAGFTSEELHEFFLIDHFGSETKELFGRKKLKPLKRSSRLTKSEFADFMDHIVRFAAERSIVLSLPGEE